MQHPIILDDPAKWRRIRDGHPRGLELYERHYSARPNRKSKQFIGPGESLALLTNDETALFVWWKQKYRADRQIGVNCAVFRNENPLHLSSSLILQAEVLARARWPNERLFTFVNASKVDSVNPGYCFKKAGWVACGLTTKGLLILEKH